MADLLCARVFKKGFRKCTVINRSCLSLVTAVTLILAPSAMAGWNPVPEKIGQPSKDQHPTWIYTPSEAMPNGKHSLLIALHGCAQSHTEMKEFGNLATTAEANDMVVAVPSVGSEFF